MRAVVIGHEQDEVGSYVGDSPARGAAWPSSRSHVTLLIAVVALLLAVHACAPTDAAARTADLRAAGLRVADRLLSLQDDHGALRDAPGSPLVNEDSCMEYALWGLAAAYSETGDARYLAGLRRGVRWLAGRVVMSSTRWRGSLWYAYRARPPYGHAVVSPGGDVADVRGVDASSALLAYDLWLYSVLSGDNGLAARLKPRIEAAVAFVLRRDRAPSGYFWSSWQRRRGETRWRLYRYQYTADQADVALGLEAAWRLYGDARARRGAAWLRGHVPAAFFLSTPGRFAVGREQGGRDRSFDGFDGIYPQGYLSWVFGPGAETSAAAAWLEGRRRADGSYRCYAGDPLFSLTPDMAALAAAAHGSPAPEPGLDWLLATTYDAASGAVGDSARDPRVEYSNVDGFTALALLGPPPGPFAWEAPAGTAASRRNQ